MKVLFEKKNFREASLNTILLCNSIIDEYQGQGFDLTLRQLYYQMVSRDHIANNQKEYNKLGKLLSNARLAGLVSWDAIVDRTRNVRSKSHWTTPRSVLRSAAYSYMEDMWENQEYRPEVWIEKDALIGVIENICNNYDVPYFSCRGYVSQSEMWRAGYNRLRSNDNANQTTVIIHLGDHDPSGMDMTRDIRERLAMFSHNSIMEIERVALNMDQVEELKPPPNPAKFTDTRAKAYVLEYGYSSWELDALEPSYISDLISNTVSSLIDFDLWEETQAKIDEEKETLNKIANRFQEVKDFLD